MATPCPLACVTGGAGPGARSPGAAQALTAACFPPGHQRDGADRAAGLAECDALRDCHLQVLRDLSARHPSRGPASFLCPSRPPHGDSACSPTRSPTRVGAVAGGSSSASWGTGLPAPTAPGSTSAAHPRTRVGSLPGPACLLPPGSRAQTRCCPPAPGAWEPGAGLRVLIEESSTSGSWARKCVSYEQYWGKGSCSLSTTVKLF